MLYCILFVFIVFAVVMHKEKEDNNGGNTILPHIHGHDGYRTRELSAFEHGLLDGDMFLQVTTPKHAQLFMKFLTTI